MKSSAVEVSRPTNQRRYGGYHAPAAVYYSRQVKVGGLTMTWTGWAEGWRYALAALSAGTLVGISGSLTHEDGASCYCKTAEHAEWRAKVAAS